MQAKAILEKVVSDSSDKKHEGWVNSYNLLQQINKPAFQFEVEKVNLPAQPFRALVKYINVPALHFRIIKATPELRRQMEERNEDDAYWNNITKATPLRSWQQTLPATTDLQQHGVEIKIDALPVGEYYLLAAASPDFNKKKTQLGGQFFYVSNISYISQGPDHFVLHRESGQPLTDAKVAVYQYEYDYNTSRYRRNKTADYRSNDKGYFRVADVKAEGRRRYDGYTFDITHGNDRLNLEERNYGYHYYDGERNEPQQPTRIFSLPTDPFTARDKRCISKVLP